MQAAPPSTTPQGKRPLALKLLPAVAFAHDVAMAALTFVLAMYMRLGPDFNGPYITATLAALPIFMGVAAFSFLVFRLYRGLWRFASMQDLILVGEAVTVAIILFLPALYYLGRLGNIPRSVPLIMWFVLLILLGAPRFLYRAVKDRRLSISRELRARGRIPVILVGAGDGAVQFIRAMAAHGAPYWVVGALDDEGQGLTGRKLHGVTIMGEVETLAEAVATLRQRGRQPQRVVITKAPGEITGERLGRLADQADALGLSVGLMPSLIEFRDASAGSDGNPSLELNPIAVEDLLGRPQTILDRAAVERLVAGRRVLITGAGGSIGAELTRQVAAIGPARLVLLDQSEFNLYSAEIETNEAHPALPLGAYIADVREAPRIRAIFAAERPEIVFHAAALKHVPLVEKNPAEGILTNTGGTRVIADAAIEIGATAMVQISTDKAVQPVNVMGASKRLAEAYTQALDVSQTGAKRTAFITVRFGNVLGSTGSVVPLFQRQIAAGGPITVTHPDIERYFMTIREAVQLVLQASAHRVESHGGEGRLFVLDMGKPVKIVELARRMIVLSGLRPDHDIEIKFTGLRPGEKLSEGLFEAEETPVPTALPGVLSASPLVRDLAGVKAALDRLERAALAGDTGQLIALIADFLPYFAKHYEGRRSAA